MRIFVRLCLIWVVVNWSGFICRWLRGVVVFDSLFLVDWFKPVWMFFCFFKLNILRKRTTNANTTRCSRHSLALKWILHIPKSVVGLFYFSLSLVRCRSVASRFNQLMPVSAGSRAVLPAGCLCVCVCVIVRLSLSLSLSRSLPNIIDVEDSSG